MATKLRYRPDRSNGTNINGGIGASGIAAVTRLTGYGEQNSGQRATQSN